MEDNKIKYKKIYQPVDDTAMERLIEVMNDKPTLIKLANADWEVTALKPAVLWMIAQEACTIHRETETTFEDIIKCFANNLPSVVRIVTLALLNDKERIEKDYDRVYDKIRWESEERDWGILLFEILSKLDVGFFFQITDAIQMFRQRSLKRKMTTEEQKLLLLAQHGAK